VKDITFGKMINLNHANSITIPFSWIEKLDEESHNYAIFLKNNPNMFRFIPTKTPKVKEFFLRLTQLEENFLEKLFKVFEQISSRYKIKPIYSSGVCFVEDDCYYFFLIEKNDDEIENQLTNNLKEIQGVEQVIVSIIE